MFKLFLLDLDSSLKNADLTFLEMHVYAVYTCTKKCLFPIPASDFLGFRRQIIGCDILFIELLYIDYNIHFKPHSF